VSDTAPGTNNTLTLTATTGTLGGTADGQTFVFVYTAQDTGLTMVCTGGSLAAKYRPAQCRL
jgi:type IV pilus assembly protein PilA